VVVWKNVIVDIVDVVVYYHIGVNNVCLQRVIVLYVILKFGVVMV